MVRMLNFAVVAILALLIGGFFAVGYYFGGWAMFWAIAGWAGSTALWQFAHKSRYGHWFGSPILDGDALDGRYRRAPDET